MIQSAVAIQSEYRRNSIARLKMSERARQNRMSKTPSSVRITWSTIEVDGPSLQSGASSAAAALVAEAMQLAGEHDKDEVLVVNIAPGATVGTAEVAEHQDRVEAIVKDAAVRLGVEPPVMRLSLRAGEYDLRCYVGVHRPSDYEQGF